MRRLLILSVALIVLLALAVPVGAAKPDKPGPPGDSGNDPVLAGTTCADMNDDGYFKGVDDSGSFGLPLTTAQSRACFDVSNVSEIGNWTIGYNVTAGSLRELIVSVRDSAAPGDLCDETRLRNAVSGQITLTPNARDYANACGITYAEWVGDSLIELADETVDSPLAFLIWARGTKDLNVTFTIGYPTNP